MAAKTAYRYLSGEENRLIFHLSTFHHNFSVYREGNVGGEIRLFLQTLHSINGGFEVITVVSLFGTELFDSSEGKSSFIASDEEGQRASRNDIDNVVALGRLRWGLVEH